MSNANGNANKIKAHNKYVQLNSVLFGGTDLRCSWAKHARILIRFTISQL